MHHACCCISLHTIRVVCALLGKTIYRGSEFNLCNSNLPVCVRGEPKYGPICTHQRGDQAIVLQDTKFQCLGINIITV